MAARPPHLPGRYYGNMCLRVLQNIGLGWFSPARPGSLKDLHKFVICLFLEFNFSVPFPHQLQKLHF